MEVDPRRASFLFDVKGHGSETDIPRSSIDDPGSHDLVVNALSEAAASNQFSAAVVESSERGSLGTSYYPLINPQPDFVELLAPLPFTNQLVEGATSFYNTALSPYGANAYQQLQMATVPLNMLSASSQLQTHTTLPWAPTTDQSGLLSVQEVFSMPTCSMFMSAFACGDMSRQTMGSQHGTSVCPPIFEDIFNMPDHCGSNDLCHFVPTGQGTASTNHASILGLIQDPLARADGLGPTDPTLMHQNGDLSDIPSSPIARGKCDSTSPQHQVQDTRSKAFSLAKSIEAPEDHWSPPNLPAQDDLMANFNIRPQPPSQKRFRKSFTKDGKRKVQLVRKNGACLCCRSRKLSCSANGVCNTCLRLVSNPRLAPHICIRSKLKDSYIGVRDLHGASLDRRRRNLQPLISSLTGLPIHIQLRVISEHGSERSTAQLNLLVMRCSSSPFCRWKRLQKMSGIYITSDITYDERYVIIPTSLPTVDEFDTFGRSVLLKEDGSHSGTITQLLDQFLSLYCSRGSKSRLRYLSNLTSRIASLNNLVAYSFLNLHDGSFDLLDRHSTGGTQQRFVSETVHDQIRLLAADGLEPAEKLVSSEIDDLSRITGSGRHARIIAGICVLRLALLYRDRWVRDEIRTGLPNNTNRHQFRLEKAASFYKRLTVAYSTLCRENDTPLTVEWEDEADALAEEESASLADTFSQLQPAFQEFCEEKLFRQHDDIFRDLVAKFSRGQSSRKRRRIAS